MLALLREDEFRRVSAVEQTDSSISQRPVHADQVAPAPGETSFDIRCWDIVSTVPHSFCHPKLSHLWTRQGEIDQFDPPFAALQALDQAHIAASGKGCLKAEVFARRDVPFDLRQ